MYYKRRIYLDRILPFMGTPMIKVITGMRRTGKSVLLRQIAEVLKERGEKICFINMELMENYRFRNPVILHNHIKQMNVSVVIIDEVQDIAGWEEVTASLLAEGDTDIYLSGSNASMLSTDLASRISGRYIEFRLYPLGLEEFIQFRGNEARSLEEEFWLYLKLGGMPGIHSMDLSSEIIYQYLSSVLDSVILKDVIIRNNIHSAALLESVFRFLADNIGSLYSGKKISDYLSSHGRKTSANTVIDYVKYMVDACALHDVKRFDLRGKRQLAYTSKAFLTDLSFRHTIFGYREGAISGFLENIVFMELLRRGYSVHIGTMADKEIDFVAEKGDSTLYLQVAYLLASEETLSREFSILEAIPDNYPKLVLSMDKNIPPRNGINQVYLPEFLITPERFI
ncbi:MAG: ATP-binding protein [Candidatus Sabulitectum sp.]|nr:ATP-binding protein [Candidatus Sabulitectum sp.]